MPQFMLLHYGFEKPSDEEMQAWMDWFAAIEKHTVDHGRRFVHGREISAKGTQELPFGADSITGYTVVEAEDMEAAQALAASNPYVHAIRIYQMSDS